MARLRCFEHVKDENRTEKTFGIELESLYNVRDINEVLP